VRAGIGPELGRGWIDRAKGVKVDRIRKDVQTVLWDCEGISEVAGHGGSLADDAVGAAVKQPVEEPVVAGKPCQRRRSGTVLADDDAYREAEEGADEEQQEVEMEHVGKNQPWAEFAQEPEQGESG
jgi:hypothetical protein